MKIKEGYNNKELEIKVSGRRNQNAEVWLIQKGLPTELERYSETLSYASLQELLELKKEIEDAILEITGINRTY